MKWIKDLNVRPENIKLLEEKIGKTLSEINHSRILYDPHPRILEIKAKRNTFESVLMRLMNLEPIIQSESEKDKYCILTHIYGI